MSKSHMDSDTRAYLRSYRDQRRARLAEARQREAAEREVAVFNEKCPVGTPVRYWTWTKEGPGRTGTTRSAAQVLGWQPVVWIDGVAGCVSLSHVEADTQ